MTSSQTFTIDVTDAPPSTPVDSDGAANQVAVSAPNGTYVGVTASSTDVNGPAVTYSLTGDTSGGGFTVDPSTGMVTVADTSKISSLRIRATTSRSRPATARIRANIPSISPSFWIQPRSSLRVTR